MKDYLLGATLDQELPEAVVQLLVYLQPWLWCSHEAVTETPKVLRWWGRKTTKNWRYMAGKDEKLEWSWSSGTTLCLLGTLVPKAIQLFIPNEMRRDEADGTPCLWKRRGRQKRIYTGTELHLFHVWINHNSFEVKSLCPCLITYNHIPVYRFWQHHLAQSPETYHHCDQLSKVAVWSKSICEDPQASRQVVIVCAVML